MDLCYTDTGTRPWIVLALAIRPAVTLGLRSLACSGRILETSTGNPLVHQSA